MVCLWHAQHAPVDAERRLGGSPVLPEAGHRVFAVEAALPAAADLFEETNEPHAQGRVIGVRLECAFEAVDGGFGLRQPLVAGGHAVPGVELGRRWFALHG